MDNLYDNVTSYDNLFLAYQKARKHKTQRPEVLEFEQGLVHNLLDLQFELRFHSYRPRPLTTFIIRDPKTRKISKSAFCDRVVHHALCNIIEPLFEKSFIFDSYANRIGKGVLKAVERFEEFSCKVSLNHIHSAFVLKADIRHYFETVNHTILTSLVKRRVQDPRILWLIQKILNNYGKNNCGMPLGNLTSQFFANVYLHELDHYIKQTMGAKYYIRYVDDFVILDLSREKLEYYKCLIDSFLRKNLALELHPQKSKVILLKRGVEFLGFNIFPHHKLLKRRNVRKFLRKRQEIFDNFDNGLLEYDAVYDFMEGWSAYAKKANSYKLRKKILANFEVKFKHQISTKEIGGNYFP